MLEALVIFAYICSFVAGYAICRKWMCEKDPDGSDKLFCVFGGVLGPLTVILLICAAVSWYPLDWATKAARRLP